MWDKTRPQGSEKIRNSDDLLRENNQALEDALSEGHEFETGGDQSGKHVSPTFKDVGSDPDQPTSTNEIRLYNKEQVLYTIDDSGATRGVNRNTDIPSGTKMLFKQDSAPSGWTFKSEDNDRVLINASTEGDGGQTGGDWQLPTTGGHSLTKDELPHIKGEADFRSTGTGDHPLFSAQADPFKRERSVGASRKALSHEDLEETGDYLIIEFGNDNAHNHSMPDDWRPQYVKTITCSKD